MDGGGLAALLLGAYLLVVRAGGAEQGAALVAFWGSFVVASFAPLAWTIPGVRPPLLYILALGLAVVGATVTSVILHRARYALERR